MAVESKNRHYVLRDIHRWHWVAMARSLGLADRVEALITELIERTPAAFDAVANTLPENFPAPLFDSLRKGTEAAIKRFAREPDQHSGPHEN